MMVATYEVTLSFEEGTTEADAEAARANIAGTPIEIEGDGVDGLDGTVQTGQVMLEVESQSPTPSPTPVTGTSCGTGTTLVGNACVAVVTCGDGTTLINNVCTVNLGEGTELSGGTCVPDFCDLARREIACPSCIENGMLCLGQPISAFCHSVRTIWGTVPAPE
jgi:hypothetical protein